MKKISRPLLLVSFLVLACFVLLVSLLFIPEKTQSAQWVQTNGPCGGYIHCIAMEGKNILAGTEGSGIFLSTDNGTSWKEANSGLISKNVYSLAISGANIFAGTYGGGVFLSTDNGNNWSAIDSGLTNIDVYSSYIGGTDMFVGTNGKGVWKRPSD